MATMTSDLLHGFDLGRCRVEPLRGTVTGPKGVVRHVEPKVMDVLVYLAGRANEVVAREELNAAVWEGRPVTDESLTRAIRELRRALHGAGGDSNCIETVPKRGYCLAGEVRLPEDGSPSCRPVGPAARQKRIVSGRNWRLALIALLAIGAAWIVYDRSSVPAVADNTIAVLPFVNLSPDPDDIYFSDGVSEEILNTLAEVRGLRVIARSSSFQFRQGNDDIREIGTALRVATILEGTVRKVGTNVRISAQLVSAEDAFQIWSGAWDRELSDVLEIQDEIADAVVDNLRAHLDLGPESAIATGRFEISNEAYDAYLRGLFYLNRIFAPGQEDTNIEAATVAVQRFDEATALAPDFAPAWAMKVIALQWQATLKGIPDDEAMPVVEASINRALELAPDLAEVQYAAAEAFWALGAPPEPVLQHYDRAIELNPNYGDAYSDRALALLVIGRYKESFASSATAFELNRLDKWAFERAMYADFYQGRLDDLDEQMFMERQMWPKAYALVTEAHLRFEFGQLDHFPDLRRRADEISPAFGLEPPYWITSAPRHFGEAYLALGLPEFAEHFMGDRYHDVLDLYEGDYDRAIEYLEAEIEAGKGHPWLFYRFHRDIVASLAEAYLYSGRYDALAGIDRWLPDRHQSLPLLPYFDRGNPPWPQVAHTYALLETGRDDLAKEWLDWLATLLEDRLRQGIRVPNHYYELARVRVMQGRTDEAYEALEQAIDMGWRRWYFDRDPVLQPIRGLPRFSSLRERYEADIVRMREAVTADFGRS